jgi:hypothetical protein
MEPPLMGEHEIVVEDVRHVDIHASRFLDLVYVLADDASGQRHVGRIGPESVEGEARPGARFAAQFAMRQMTRLRAIGGA